MKKLIHVALIATSILFLVSCGGGGGGSSGGGGGGGSSSQVPLVDTDKDGIADVDDPDDDNDGVLDSQDAFPLDKNESVDTDGDKVGNNADLDDDGDDAPDDKDAFPLDKTESVDFDGDGIGDNADTDDDNDGVPDTTDTIKGIVTDLPSSFPAATNYLQDTSRGYFYVTHKLEKSLDVLNAKTGNVLKTLKFDYMPESMYLASDASKLYVTLTTKNHDYYWFDNQIGYVVTIDLKTIEQTASLTLALDPYDLVVTSKGKLIVSGGSGQWTNIIAYDLATGTVLGMASGIRQSSSLVLSPNESLVYSVDQEGGSVQKYDISDVGITSTGYSGYIDNVRLEGDLWVTPDGKYLISKGGTLIKIPELTFAAQLTAVSVRINSITFDPASQTALLALSDGTVQLLSLSSYEVIKQITLFGQAQISASMGESLYSVVSQSGITSIIKQEHPCPKCATNSAPKAAFTYTPAAGDTTKTYVFDASTSTDVDKDSLSYRWDINGDGVWDTAYAVTAKYETRFYVAGTKYIRLQVKDAWGLTATATQSIEVAQGSDTGTPVVDSVPNMLSFSITNSIANKANNKIYLTDKSAKRLYVVDTATGITQRYFTFEGYPENLALSPDGSRLFVTVKSKETDSYYWNEARLGYIAVIDTTKDAYINTFAFGATPYQITAKSSDKVIVMTESNGGSLMQAYDANTGLAVGSSNDGYYASGLATNSAGTVLYKADWSSIARYDISGNNLTLVSTGNSSNLSVGNQLWVSPDDQFLVTKSGTVIRVSDMTVVASLGASNVTISSVAFDDARQVGFFALSNGTISVVNLKSFEIIKQVSALGQVGALSVVGDRLYMTSTLAGLTSIISVDHPCTACATNQSPAAALTIAPGSGDTNKTFSFDASASTDAEAGALTYRWDLDGDDVWDSGFSSTATTARRYSVPGAKAIRLQVKDSMGATSTLSKTVNVTQGVDYGVAVSNSVANTFGFVPSDSVADSARSKLYLTDKVGKRVYLVDLVTGLTERYFEFEFVPERMTLSPDASTIYVSLLAAQHSYENMKPGYVAVIDLADQAVTKTFPLGVDPFDLAVSKAGILMVSPSYYQSLNGAAYSATAGDYLFSASNLGRNVEIAAHPINEWLYGLDSGIVKYSISNASLVELARSSWNQNIRFGNTFWITPDGAYLVTQGGDVLSANDLSLVAKLTVDNVSINSVSFDKNAKLVFVSSADNFLSTFNSVSWELIAKIKINGTGLNTSVVGSKIYTLITNQASGSLVSSDHPCLPCATNQAPAAKFSVTPAANGDTGTNYVFDASTSTDPENGSLTYRWDLNGDGIWDTNFSSSATLSKRFTLSGSKSVSVQVKDAFGLVSTASSSFSVAQGVNAGTAVESSTPFVFDFAASYTATDKANSKLYVSDRGAKRVYVVNLITGLTEKYFEFEFMPERMAIDPEGKFLYLALTVQDHSSYWWGEEQSGYVAVFNLATGNNVKVFATTIDPYGIAAVANRKVIVSSGSGQWTYIHAYDGDSGNYLGQSGIREASNLYADPAGKFVFAADTDLSPSDIEKFDVQGAAITSLGDSPYHGDHRMSGNVWVTPNGQYLITAGGDVYLSSDMTYVKSMTSQDVLIKSLAFNTNNQTVVTLGSDKKVTTYSLDGFGISGAATTAFADPREIIVIGNKVYLLKLEDAKFRLQAL